MNCGLSAWRVHPWFAYLIVDLMSLALQILQHVQMVGFTGQGAAELTVADQLMAAADEVLPDGLRRLKAGGGDAPYVPGAGAHADGDGQAVPVRAGLQQALAALGFKGGTRGMTEWNQWVVISTTTSIALPLITSTILAWHLGFS